MQEEAALPACLPALGTSQPRMGEESRKEEQRVCRELVAGTTRSNFGNLASCHHTQGMCPSCHPTIGSSSLSRHGWDPQHPAVRTQARALWHHGAVRVS